MSGSEIVSVRVPFQTVRRSSRKVIVVPDGSTPVPAYPASPEVNAVFLRAIIRAWRWRHIIEEGGAASIIEIAERENLTDSFVGRMIALTTLAPDLLEACSMVSSRRVSYYMV